VVLVAHELWGGREQVEDCTSFTLQWVYTGIHWLSWEQHYYRQMVAVKSAEQKERSHNQWWRVFNPLKIKIKDFTIIILITHLLPAKQGSGHERSDTLHMHMHI